MVDNGGFTVDGVPVTTYGVELAYSPGQPMLPSTRDRTVEIPGRPGAYWFDSDPGQRTFSLPCRFTGCANAAALDTLIRVFARVWTQVLGKPRQVSLVFDDAPTLTYLVRYNGQIPFDRAWVGCTEFTLELIADDPFAYAAESTTSGTITTSPGVVSVTSAGNTTTPAKICVTNNTAGAIDGFEITIEYEN